MFIDAHLHTVLRKGLPRDAADSNFATPDELIAMMNRSGVDKGVLLPSNSPEGSFQQSTNDHQHAAYLRHSLTDGHLAKITFENISWRNANRLFNLGL